MRKVVALVLGFWLLLGVALPAAATELGGVARVVVTDEQGRPVAGAEVELYRLDAGLVSVMTTDAGGRFVVAEKAAPGSLWQYRVLAKGYKTLDSGWMELPRSGYQSLKLTRMYGGLRVRVVDGATGTALMAQVLVIGPQGQVAFDALDLDGRVELDLLPPGQYTVLAGGGTFVPFADEVAVAAGSTATVTARVEPAVIGMAGEVQDMRTGLPVAGASVHLLTDDGADLNQGPVEADGRFRTGLAARDVSGPVRLLAWADGYRPVLTAPVTLMGGQVQDFSGKDAVRLAPATGRVAGVVLKHDGAPRAGATVVLEAKGYGWMESLQTDERGAFAFASVQADPSVSYRVFVAADHEVAATDWLALTEGVTDQLILQTKSGFAQTGGTAEVGGVVLAADGQPLADAKVEFFRRGELVRSVQTDGSGTFLLKSMPVTRGPWVVFDPYTVRISKDGYVTTSQVSVGGQDAVSFDLASGTRAFVRATLRVAVTELRGRVVGARGEAVAGAEVYLMAGPTSPVGKMVRTDAQGWYTVPNVPVRPGVQYVLMGKAKGYQTFVGVMVTPEAVAQQSAPTVRLVARGRLYAGQVVDRLGGPVPGAVVELRRADGLVAATVEADEFGAYSLTGEPGLALVARRPGYEAGAAGVVGQAGSAMTELVLAPAAATVSGQVFDTAGQGVGGVLVELVREGRGSVEASVRTAPDGSYRFEGIGVLGTGRFWLRVRDGGGRQFGGSLIDGTDLVPLMELRPGQERVVDLLMR
jgi:protocatechuate 3,4-dioxygenase beta subunit